MRDFFDEQGRTRVFARGVRQYVEGGNPRRTPLIGKITIYEWKLTRLTALVWGWWSIESVSGGRFFFPLEITVLTAVTAEEIIQV